MSPEDYVSFANARYNIDEKRGTVEEIQLGGIKHDDGKAPWHLLSVPAMDEMLEVLRLGAIDYGDHNWRKGFVWTRLISAAARHLFAFMWGEDRDPKTKRLHTAHLMCCAMFLTEHVLRGLGQDDRYKEAGCVK